MSGMAVSVSGSFHRHLGDILEAVQTFKDQGVEVLSPADPRAVDSIGPFIFVASDQHRSIRLVQDRHLASISQSSFVWLVAPDGYVGQSASLELGFAIAFGIPVLGTVVPPDLTLQQYVSKVESIDSAIEFVRRLRRAPVEGSNLLLLDPAMAISTAHQELEIIGRHLTTQSSVQDSESVAGVVSSKLRQVRHLLTFVPRPK